MSPESAPDKTDPSRFAVVVDPTGWPHDLERLAETVRTACRSSAPDRTPPALAALLERLRAGATTVAEDWGKGRAQTLLATLQAEGVEAKLLRRRAPPRANPPKPLPGKGPGAPAAKPPTPPPRPAHSPVPPARPAASRPTLMDGWSHFVTPDPDVGAPQRLSSDEVARAPADPPASPFTASARPAPTRPALPKPRAGSDGVGRMPMLGWGDVLDPSAASPQLGRPAQDAADADDADARAIERTEPRLPAHTPDDAVAAVAAVKLAPSHLPPEEPTAPARVPPPAAQAHAELDATPEPQEPALAWAGGVDADDAERLGEHAAANQGEDPRTAPKTVPELPVSAAFRALLEMPGRPVPAEELTPSPLMAAIFGVLAPGGGQIYLGQREEGFRVATAAPLVLPWFTAAHTAWLDAAQVAAGQRPARTRPQPWAAMLFVASVWVCLGLLVGGALWVYHSLTAPTGTPRERVVAVTPSEPDASPDVETPALDESIALQSTPIAEEVERRQREARARRLTIQAHEACEAEDYPRCLMLSDQARRLEPDLHQAVRLFHRASLALEPGTGQGTGDDERGASWPPAERSP